MNTGTRVTTAPGSSGAEILFVIGTLEVGGTERHIATLAPALVKLGWPVSVYSLAGGGVLQEAMEGEGVNVLVPPFRLSAPRSRSWRA